MQTRDSLSEFALSSSCFGARRSSHVCLTTSVQLPQEVRDLAEPPFTVDWHPVAIIVSVAPGTGLLALKDTLKRKEVVRTPAISDLILRLEPGSQLALEITAAQDEHWNAGGDPAAFK